MQTFKKMSIVVVGLSLLATACTSTRTQKSAGEAVDDTVTLAKVKSALIGDPLTKAYEIDVDLFKGIVQLNGFVDSAAERSRATVVARDVGGVKEVRNNLGLAKTPDTVERVLDDSAITGKVKEALVDSPDTKAYQINVDTNGAIVRLSGFVDSADAKHAASFVARSVSGVRSVRNDIDVK